MMSTQIKNRQTFKPSRAEFNPSMEFYLEKKKLVRKVVAGQFSGASFLDISGRARKIENPNELSRFWLINRLRGIRPKMSLSGEIQEYRIVDLCCGAGGFATGLKWACESINLRPVVSLAVDTNERARAIYKLNVRPLNLLAENVANLVDYDLTGKDPDYQPKFTRPDLDRYVGNIDLVIAGPPCEGNSNFNNHTRRRDKRNELYVATIATAIAMKAKVVIIENVTTVVNAHENVVARALSMLQVAGYKIGINEIVLDASKFGVAQRRKRHFLVAARNHVLREGTSENGLVLDPISAMDVLSDLMNKERESPIDQPANISDTNRRRIDFLFDNDEFDLPRSERPRCHRDKDHNYHHIYGRMLPDQPCQTITTGFLSPGRGRYIHPALRRGLTLREGARLQGFPDDYKWHQKGCKFHKSSIATLIGDAVPPPLGYTIGLIGLALT